MGSKTPTFSSLAKAQLHQTLFYFTILFFNIFLFIYFFHNSQNTSLCSDVIFSPPAPFPSPFVPDFIFPRPPFFCSPYPFFFCFPIGNLPFLASGDQSSVVRTPPTPISDRPLRPSAHQWRSGHSHQNRSSQSTCQWRSHQHQWSGYHPL